MTKMAEVEDDKIVDEIVVDGEQLEADKPSGENAEGGDLEGDEINDDEVVISIGEEAPPTEEEKAPDWVRVLRKSHKESQRENKALKAKLEEANGTKKPEQLGTKPTLESCDYDEGVFEAKIAEWYDDKRASDDREAEVVASQQQKDQAWSNTVTEYNEKKTLLKVRDFDEAETNVTDDFDETQRGMILHAAENSAQLIYALGKNDKARKELASIKDPVKFAFAAAKLETKLKVTNRKAATKPEQKVEGSGRSSGTTDSTLERLREEASKSGDYTAIRKYKKSKSAA